MVVDLNMVSKNAKKKIDKEVTDSEVAAPQEDNSSAEGQGAAKPTFAKRSVGAVAKVTVPKTKQMQSKRVAKEDNFSNNKEVGHLPSGRPSYFGESRTAQATIRLRPTVLEMAMEYGENEWGETSRNSVIERLLCKALDVDLKTLEPKS